MTGNFAYFGGFFLSPLLLEYGYHMSTGQAGGFVLGRPIAFAICSPIAGYVAVRVGERVSALAGTTCLTISMLLFAWLSPSSGSFVIIAALVLSGLGMGVAMPSTSSLMANEVDPSEFGVMSAAQMLAMQIGQVAGAEIFVALQSSVQRARHLTHASRPSLLLGTFQLPFEVGAGAAVLSVLFSFFFRSLQRERSGGDRAESVDHIA
jgi:MFS family permease